MCLHLENILTQIRQSNNYILTDEINKIVINLNSELSDLIFILNIFVVIFENAKNLLEKNKNFVFIVQLKFCKLLLQIPFNHVVVFSIILRITTLLHHFWFKSLPYQLEAIYARVHLSITNSKHSSLAHQEVLIEKLLG
eukprot:c26171_g1_i1.p1 GENE.c26171_g1_i1~~c26171_g1_i1.p1  ORF type:complete len:139 (-),score=29.77 c26171_g1_i1:6-422(-)